MSRGIFLLCLALTAAWAASPGTGWNQFGGNPGRTFGTQSTGQNAPAAMGLAVAPAVEGVVYSNVPLVTYDSDIITLTAADTENTLGTYSLAGKFQWSSMNLKYHRGRLAAEKTIAVVTPSMVFLVGENKMGHRTVRSIPHMSNTTHEPTLLGGQLYLASSSPPGVMVINTHTMNKTMFMMQQAPELDPIATLMGVVAASETHLYGWSTSGKKMFMVPHGVDITGCNPRGQLSMNSEGVIVVASGCGGNVVAFSFPMMGKKLWGSVSLSMPIAMSSTIIGKNDVFAVGGMGAIQKINAMTGSMNSIGEHAFTKGDNGTLVLDEGAQRLYYRSGSKLVAMDISDGTTVFAFNAAALPRRSPAKTQRKTQWLEPVAVAHDGTLFARLNTGVGGHYEPVQENAMVRLGNSFKPPTADPIIEWNNAGVTACIPFTYEAGRELPMQYTLEAQSEFSPFLRAEGSHALFPTTYMRQTVAMCLTTDLTPGEWRVRIAVNGSTQTGHTKFQQLEISPGMEPEGMKCPAKLYFSSLTGGQNKKQGKIMMKNQTAAEDFYVAMPTPYPAHMGMPKEGDYVSFVSDALHCADNGLGQNVTGGLLMQVDGNPSWQYEAIGKVATGKARVSADFDGDGKMDYVHFWPSETGPGQDVYMFTAYYNKGIYDLLHDDPIHFNLPPFNHDFTGGKIQIDFWLNEVPDNRVVHAVSTTREACKKNPSHQCHWYYDNPRGPTPYQSGMHAPFYQEEEEAPECQDVCPDAFYFEGYLTP